MKETNKKFKINKKAVIIAGIILLCLIVPDIANAGITQILGNAAADLLSRLVDLILGLLATLLKLGAAVFEVMLHLGFSKRGIDIAKIGWSVTRDVANLFFVVFMIIIAFGTILRIEQYGVKTLLPKLIIIALLINFSFVICSVIIDFSNITANFFVDRIDSALQGKSMTATFVDSLNISSIMIGNYGSCLEKKTKDLAECAKLRDAVSFRAFYDCNANVNEEYYLCADKIDDAIKAAKSSWNGILSILISGIVGSIVILIAAFTFFAGAILLLIRVIVLWFLIMIVPLVFVCYIMPALRSNWQKWWKTFLNWCIFAPVYAFFIWIAVIISIEKTNRTITTGAEKAAQFITSPGAIPNPFITNPAQELLAYGFVIAILIGGLLVAKQLGIYGADAALKIGQKWGKGIGKWAGGTSMRPLRNLGTMAGAGALGGLGRLFGGKLGRRMEARATQLRRAPEERPEHKAYAKLIAAMSDPDVLKEMKTKGIRGLIATREAAKRGALRDANSSDAAVAMDKLRVFNEIEALNKLKEVRPDAIRDRSEQEAVARKIVQEGNLNKIPAIALQNKRLVEAITEFALPKQIESLRGTSPQHINELINTLKNIAVAGASNKIHEAYASQTGDITRMSAAQKVGWAKVAGEEGLKRLQTFDINIAENIPVNQLNTILQKIVNSAVASSIAQHLKNTPTAAAYNLANNDPYIKNL